MPTRVDHGDRVPGAPPTLLFVCVANVCRSPTMQFLTAHHLDRVGIGESWNLSSAGTAAHEGSTMCPVAAEAVGSLSYGQEFATWHRSTPIDEGMVRQADLILVTSEAERGPIAKLSPPSRSRTFTMVEAALLAESAVRSPRLAWDDQEPLGGLVSNMSAARGTISLPRPAGVSQRLRRREHTPVSLDVRDVHAGDAVDHRETLDDLRWCSTRLADAVAALPRGLVAGSGG